MNLNKISQDLYTIKHHDQIEKYFGKYCFSLNSKDPCSIESLNKKSLDFKKNLINSFILMKNYGSIKEIKADDLSHLKIDIFTYSFPCQDLSTAGFYWKKSKGMDKDSKTRSSLVWEVGRILKELKKIKKSPKILIMENVKSIVSKKHIESFNEWTSYLKSLGYKTIYKILNGKEFGIPQNRERVIAISFTKDMNISIEKWDKLEKEYKEKFIFNKSIDFFLKKNYKKKSILDEALISTPKKTPSRQKMFEKCKNLNISQFCWTISTKQDRYPNAGIIHFEENEKEYFKSKNDNYRFLTPRECFLLMGFLDNDYNEVKKLNLGYSSEYLLAGNSIIVNVLESVFYFISKIFGEYYEKYR